MNIDGLPRILSHVSCIVLAFRDPIRQLEWCIRASLSSLRNAERSANFAASNENVICFSRLRGFQLTHSLIASAHENLFLYVHRTLTHNPFGE